MRNLPNLLTLLRLVLVPVMGYFAWSGRYAIALPIFLVAALTDLADGYIARRFNLVSKLGIVAGTIAYRIARGRLDIKPTRLSKVNTAIEFAVLLLVMAAAAGWIDATAWMLPSFVIVFVTATASGIQYVWRWGRMAFAEHGRSYSDEH